MRLVRMGRLSVEVEMGDLTVIALSDGETAMPVTHLRGRDGEALADLAQADLVEGKLRLPVWAFLVKGSQGCLLIDTGAADAWHPSLGRLGEALREAGVSAGEVTAVALTHTHVDHLSGLVDRDRGLAFPNAERAVPRMAPAFMRLMPLEQGDAPMRGVVAINAPGHSPGHMAYLVDGRLLIWGDVVHHAAVQFGRPEVSWGFDSDPEQARASRLALMERAVEEGFLVAGAHLPFPAIGRIERAGQGYSFSAIGAQG